MSGSLYSHSPRYDATRSGKIVLRSFVRIPLPLVLAPLLLASVCDTGTDIVVVPEFDFDFGFESGMDGWVPRAVDVGDPPIPWSVAHTTERANGGSGSVRVHLDNVNDAGKIWMERALEVAPEEPYEVEIRFMLGTADWGDVNLFKVIAGAHGASPEEAADLTFRDDTGNGASTDAGYVWQERVYTARATADEDGMLWVSIGVWGTWETARTYYVDDVRLQLTRAQ